MIPVVELAGLVGFCKELPATAATRFRPDPPLQSGTANRIFQPPISHRLPLRPDARSKSTQLPFRPGSVQTFMPVRRHTLKRRLIGLVLLSSIAALLVTYAALLTYEFYRFRHDSVRNLSALAGIIAANSSAALIFDDKALAEENLSALRAEPDITLAALYDQRGRLYATYPAAAPKAVLPGSPGREGVEFAAGRLTLFTPVMQDRRRAGTLYLSSDLGEMYGRFKIYGLVLLAVLAGSLGVSFFLSNFFQRRISQPLLVLAEMARLVSERRNFTVRVHSPRDDELGDLTRAFDAMLDQIQASHTEVEQARDEALAASRAKDDFLAALSHELRTPLNPVLLLASDAATRSDLPEPIRADFDLIRKNIELEARLIDDLLDLTRITRGKLALDLQLVDPQLALQDALETVRADARAKEISLSYNPDPGRPLVRGDPIRLQQIFWNILKNAVKFTPDGGSIAVVVRADPAAGRLILTIEDNGIGLTAEELPRIFRIFSQGEHAADGGPHRFGGLGLGLAISRTLAELHAGTIRATSRGRDRGATFVVDLPLAAESRAPATAPTLASAGPGPASAVRARCILLVEDHAATRLVLAQMLTGRGYRVLSAGSVAEARACAAQDRTIEALISDIGLPDGNGYDLMAELSAAQPLKGIALTGYGMDHDLAASRRAGFSTHLTKPVRIQLIAEALAAFWPEGRA
jgi:signal transduction histidine kinase